MCDRVLLPVSARYESFVPSRVKAVTPCRRSSTMSGSSSDHDSSAPVRGSQVMTRPLQTAFKRKSFVMRSRRIGPGPGGAGSAVPAASRTSNVGLPAAAVSSLPFGAKLTTAASAGSSTAGLPVAASKMRHAPPRAIGNTATRLPSGLNCACAPKLGSRSRSVAFTAPVVASRSWTCHTSPRPAYATRAEPSGLNGPTCQVSPSAFHSRTTFEVPTATTRMAAPSPSAKAEPAGVSAPVAACDAMRVGVPRKASRTSMLPGRRSATIRKLGGIPLPGSSRSHSHKFDLSRSEEIRTVSHRRRTTPAAPSQGGRTGGSEARRSGS